MDWVLDIKVGESGAEGVDVSVETTISTVGDGGMRVGMGVTVETMISVGTMVGDGIICVGSNVTVAKVVGDARGVTGVSIGEVKGSDVMAAFWAGNKNSICNNGAPDELPSNDFAIRSPLFFPVMITTMEFP